VSLADFPPNSIAESGGISWYLRLGSRVGNRAGPSSSGNSCRLTFFAEASSRRAVIK
jgi:hypothetical protein